MKRAVSGWWLAVSGWWLAIGGLWLAVGGCVSLDNCWRVDEDGFTWRDGRVAPGEAASDYYVVRYETPSKDQYTDSRKVFTKWDFVELRQLKDGTTVVKDGVLSTSKTRYPGNNWMRHLPRGCRNIRVKFVDSNYTIAADGVKTAPEGFVSNFNGKDLTGWRGLTREENFNDADVRRAMLPEKRWELEAKADKLMKAHWHVRDGALFFDGLKEGYSIAAAKDYGDYEVYADWRLLRVYGDSGFYVRGMPQIQIWDPNLWQGLGSGCLWNNRNNDFAAKVCADRPIGSWNTTRIKVVGNRVSVWVNGEQTADAVELENCRDAKKGIPLIGTFELQCHGDPIEFRNIFIRELPEANVPDPTKAVRGEKIDLLKDGMAGWEAVDPKARMGWSVKDGVLTNETGIDPEKTSRGGAGTTHLRTKRADFFDFDLSYDVLVPAKCNSGVYLRGRYELQVNDSYGRKLDCHNMAALYDLITPTAAAEKPAGEWQHVDVTLYRRHLTVTLNGVRIIDNQPIPGVTPGAMDGNEFVPGPILLQGDHSNASFKNMFLTKLIDDSEPCQGCVIATGKRLAERFLSRPPEAQNYKRDKLMYFVVCTWAGAIDFADKCGDKELEKRLIDLFEPFFGAKASYVPNVRHVDFSVFGSLPLNIYRHNGDKRCLEMGLGFADRQWTPIPEGKCKWMEGDPNEWLKRGFTPETRLWMDDMFMITSVQLEAYRATGDRKYADRAAKEMVMYLDEIQIKHGDTAGLYYHAPDVPYIWGRGDGWMAAGTARLMQNLPEDQPELPRILEGYRLMMAALKKFQRPDGLWGQLVDDPDIWGETSGSAMFAYAMAVGVNRGWLDREEYAPCVYRAYYALDAKLTAEGDVTDVCIGTNKKNDHQYYVDRKRVTGDAHGQAAFLWLCTELVKSGW